MKIIIATFLATLVGYKLGAFSADHNFGIALPAIAAIGTYFGILKLLK